MHTDAPPPRLGAMPHDAQALQQALQRSRALLHQRALVAAAVSAVPIPGLDWSVDAALLSKLLPQISEHFGLSPEQLDALDPDLRAHVQKAVAMVGSVFIGKLLTRQMILRLARTVGLRMGSKQLAKFIPFAGQAIAAAVGYGALRYLGERHIQDCVRVVQQAQAVQAGAQPPGSPP
ncbi:hypothetical protein [Comamonas aquatica]|uniref:hypothetical protein n=1 Tax=Comamonas aquatica TaxID=225991 RepID=UPI00244B2F57|nr:hypothetical protein [Comamonas aquatica]MDH0381799.1 hypothetical protein [Comamonas aquatica]MDH0429944.1 hypothetical protein [Comamonas aquatica]MDH0940764.1 hypothetical protein [Comamonas aquatica]